MLSARETFFGSKRVRNQHKNTAMTMTEPSTETAGAMVPRSGNASSEADEVEVPLTLFSVPDPVLVHVLEYTEVAVTDAATCVEAWQWIASLARVCLLFYELGKEIAPAHLHTNPFEHRLSIPLLRSILATPWKRENVQLFSCTDQDQNDPRLLDNLALVEVFETPQSLPALQKLKVTLEGGFELAHNIARSSNNITQFELYAENWSRSGVYYEDVSMESLTDFALLLGPLEKLSLHVDRQWVTAEKLDAFLQPHGQSLVSFSISYDQDDDILRVIANSCQQLERLELYNLFNTTSDGLEAILESVSSLRELDLKHYSQHPRLFEEVLLEHGGQLQTLHAPVARINIFTGVWVNIDIVRLSEGGMSLEKLSISPLTFSIDNIQTLFQNMGTLTSLRLYDQHNNYDDFQSQLGPELVDIFVDYAPQLKELDLGHCDWFQDEHLERMVQSQMAHWGGPEAVPLRRVTVKPGVSQLSQEGVERIKALLPRRQLRVDF